MSQAPRSGERSYKRVRLSILAVFVVGMPALAMFSARGNARVPHAFQTRAGNLASSERSPLLLQRELPPPTPLRPFPTRDDQTRANEIQRQLRELGAIEFSLDYRGDPQHFVAHCKVQLPQLAALTKAFEASHPRPLSAMLDVLTQIEQWRFEVARVRKQRRR